MANAVNKTYNALTGEDIFMGMAPLSYPSWLLAIQDNSWGKIPLVNKLSDIDPQYNPAINPNYPNRPLFGMVGGQSQMIGAWSGATFDDDRGVLHFPLQGGHADYGGNEPYTISIHTDTPTARMLRKPTGCIGNEGTFDDDLEITGKYFDGRPRSIHSYNKLVYVPQEGPLVAIQGSTSPSGQSGPTDLLKINEITGEAERFAGTSSGGTASSSGACYDKSRHCIWLKVSTSRVLAKFDLHTSTWSTIGSNIDHAGDTGLVHLPESDMLFATVSGSTTTTGFYLIDCKTGISYKPLSSGSLVGISLLSGGAAPVLDMDGGYIAVWNNSDNLEKINRFKIPNNPKTDTWVISQYEINAGNTVIPTVRASNGTFGRFFYSSSLKGFGVINATDQDIYFFKVGQL